MGRQRQSGGIANPTYNHQQPSTAKRAEYDKGETWEVKERDSNDKPMRRAVDRYVDGG